MAQIAATVGRLGRVGMVWGGFKAGIAALALVLAGMGGAAAQSATSAGSQPSMDTWDRDVFFFGGRFHTDYFGQSFTPWDTTWEDNYFVGAGYQQFFWRWGFVRFGGEIGVGDRFNTDNNTMYGAAVNSQEAWAGIVTRFDGWNLGPVHVSPALTAGFSVVNGLIGVEAGRNSTPHSDPHSDGGRFLVYLGPEVSFSLPDTNPNLEAFVRIQHRSGAFGWIADLDGSNADTVGLRWKF